MKHKDVIINDKLEESKVILIHYLRMKTEEEDWHAVADVAMDLRELEIKLKVCK